jgi:hypothetical protein
MAEENVRFSYRNFCFGALNGVFNSIDTTNTVSRLLSKDSSGNLIGNAYSLSESFPQTSNINTLEYTGPRYLNASQMKDGLPFFTFYNGFIKKWALNTTMATLDLLDTSPDFSSNNYTAMAVEHYYTTFASSTTSGTGYINVTSSGGISIGDRLLLGPSSDADNLYAYETVEVTDVSGAQIFIQPTVSGYGDAPRYEYVANDNITWSKYLYLFSNDGRLDKLNINDFSIIESHYSGIYSGVSASAWSNAYNTIGFVRTEGSNLVYVDPYDLYKVIKSHLITTEKSNKTNRWVVYGLAFDGTTIYRLQDGKTLVSSIGVFTDYSWSTYNYHRDSVAPYTKSVSISATPRGILVSQDTTTLTAVVRDQYGVGLLNILVDFDKESGDTAGYFTPLNGQAYTNSSGIAEINYTSAYYATDGTDSDFEYILLNVKADGANTDTGSAYAFDGLTLNLNKRLDSIVYLYQKASTISSDMRAAQVRKFDTNSPSTMYIKSLSKFQFPGGHWVAAGAPSSGVTKISQLSTKINTMTFPQKANTLLIESPVKQLLTVTGDTPLSQTYVSRHVSSGHTTSVTMAQFRFVEDAVPAFWSEKNNIGTNIWIRLRPYAYSLNPSTLVFKVKETSYAGDTGYIDVTGSCTVTNFDAGGGLMGIDILYNPSQDFHYGAMVFVSIVVYDNAPFPNIIKTDYWFKIIQDYKGPYIENESPSREAEDIPVDTSISFDIKDIGVGVDINTLVLYVNNKKIFNAVTSEISGGYHVSYTPTENFSYGDTVEIIVNARDASGYANRMYDMWRFYIVGSTGPWIDMDSFYPRNCTRGVPRKWTGGISFNVYGIDNTGIDPNSIVVHIGGKQRDVTITPIIYRII